MVNKSPNWRNCVLDATLYADLDYSHIRDCMQYLRSMRTLLEGRIDSVVWLVELKCELDRTLSVGFDLLALKNIIHYLEHEGLGPEVAYAERRKICGKAKSGEYLHEGDEKKALEFLELGSRAGRRAEWQYRIEVALTECVAKGWFPLFGTYTVDPNELPPECMGNRDNLWKLTPAWDRFVKKFKTEAAEACGYGRRPAAWPQGKTFFQYFAIIEHGSSKAQDHPHIHVVWMMKEIPEIWRRDPNINIPDRTRSDIAAATRLWRWGCVGSTQAVMISGSWFADNWMKQQVRKEDGTLSPRKIGSPGAVAGYLGKYMTKGNKKWNHRVKATSNLGLSLLSDKLESVKSLRLLRSLACRPMEFKTAVKLQTVSRLPMSLVRRKSKAELMKRLHTMKRPRAKRLLWTMMTARLSGFYMRYLEIVRDGIQIWRQTREQRYKTISQIGVVVPLMVHCRQMVERMEAFLISADVTVGPSLEFVRIDPIELY